jgi:hypothetical protein
MRSNVGVAGTGLAQVDARLAGLGARLVLEGG